MSDALGSGQASFGEYEVQEMVATTKKHFILVAKHQRYGKCLLKKFQQEAINPADIEGIRREYEFLKRCDSQHIVKAYELLMRPDLSTVAIVEEYAPGAQLWNQKTLPLLEILDIGVKIAQALDHLHRERHIIHCDINPSNVLYCPLQKKVTIIDFNSARGFGDSPYWQSFTLEFMAPEQSNRIDVDIDHRVDYYALGVMLFRIISGQFPFDVQDRLDYIQAHIATPPKQLVQVLPTCPTIISDLIDILLSKSPNDRYQSASGIEGDLKLIIAFLTSNTASENVSTLAAPLAPMQPITPRGTSKGKTSAAAQSILSLSSPAINSLLTTTSVSSPRPIVLRKTDQPFYFQSPGTSYGRRGQLELLAEEHRECVQRHRIKLITLAGDPGVGKTSLVVKFRQLHGIKYFAQGKLDQFSSQSKPLDIFRQILETISMILHGSSEQAQRDYVMRVKAACGDDVKLISDLAPSFAALFEMNEEAHTSGSPVSPITDSSVMTKALPSAVKDADRLNRAFATVLAQFSDEKTPAAVFFDDLQWIDSASIELLEYIVKNNVPLFIIIAYRSNEVSSAHPLMHLFLRLKEAEADLLTIELGAISREDVLSYIRDAIPADKQDMEALTDAIYEVTTGNPLFLYQLLNSFYDKQLIEYDPTRARWKYKLTDISKMNFMADFNEFCLAQLKQLDQDTQMVLGLASIIGNTFTLREIKSIYTGSTPAEQCLERAISKKMLSYRETNYKFSHDRIQKSCSQLLADDNLKKACHFKLANAILGRFRAGLQVRPALPPLTETDTVSSDPQPSRGRIPIVSINDAPTQGIPHGTTQQIDSSLNKEDANVFDAIYHFENSDDSAVLLSPELKFICELLLEAAKRISSSSISSSAVYARRAHRYLMQGVPDPWKTYHRLTFNAFVLLSELELFFRNDALIAQLHEELEKHVETEEEAVQLYHCQTGYYKNREEHGEGLKAGAACLRRLGNNFSLEPSLLACLQTLEQIAVKVKELPGGAESLSNFRKAEGRTKNVMIIEVLAMMSISAFLTNRTALWISINITAFQICLEHGVSSSAGPLISSCGFLLTVMSKHKSLGAKVSHASVKIAMGFPDKAIVAKCMIYSALAGVYDRPMLENAGEIEHAVDIARTSRDVTAIVYGATNLIQLMMVAGVRIKSCLARVELFADQVKVMAEGGEINFIFESTLRELRGEVPLASARVQSLQSIATHAQSRILSVVYLNLLKAWHTCDYSQGLEWVEIFISRESALVGTILWYESFALSTLFLFKKKQLQIRGWTDAEEAKLNTNVAKWKSFVDAAELQNFWLQTYKVFLAEQALIDKNAVQALEYYEEARSLAIIECNLKNLAIIANAVCYLFHHLGMKCQLRAAFGHCIHAYQKWDAAGILPSLQTTYGIDLKDFNVVESSSDVAEDQSCAPLAAPSSSTHSTITKKLRPDELKPPSTTTTTSQPKTTTERHSLSSAIDLQSLVQAAQAISHINDIQKLKSVLPKLIMNNAGATKLVLIEDDGQGKQAGGTRSSVSSKHTSNGHLTHMSVILDASYSSTQIQLQPDIIPLTKYLGDNHLPKTLVVAGLLSPEPICIRDATLDPMYQNDPYVLSHRPRSMAVYPVRYQTDLVGIIYLEHDSMAGVYNAKKGHEVLTVLTSQIASCILNARLKRDLDSLKGERATSDTIKFDTPLESAVQIVKALKRVAPESQHDTFEMLLQLLTRSDVLQPDLMNFEKGTSQLDKTARNWILSTMTTIQHQPTAETQKAPQSIVENMMDGVGSSQQLSNTDENSPRARSGFIYKAIQRLYKEANKKAVDKAKSPTPLRTSNFNDSQLVEYGNKINAWNYPLFSLTRDTQNHALLFVSYHLFEQNELFDRFGIDVQTFASFMISTELSYRANHCKDMSQTLVFGADKPHHSDHDRQHAADVLHASSCLSKTSRLTGVISPLEIFSLLFASTVHDIDHPGVNNAFLITQQDPLALLYNDKSVLENHHASFAFRLLKTHNICKDLPPASFKKFRSLVVELILATDLSQHLTLITNFTRLVGNGSQDVDLNKDEVKLSILQMIIKCADLSHALKDTSIHREWVNKVLEEFFDQGDREKAAGMPLSPFCDRENANISKSQGAFLTFLCKPLFDAFHSFSPMPDKMEHLAKNIDFWLHYDESSNMSTVAGTKSTPNIPLVVSPIIPTLSPTPSPSTKSVASNTPTSPKLPNTAPASPSSKSGSTSNPDLKIGKRGAK